MTDVALLASVATGASVVLAGGVGTPVFFYKRNKRKESESYWHQNYTESKSFLEAAVSGGVPHEVMDDTATTLVKILAYHIPTLKNYEESASVRDTFGRSFMGLTHLYRVDAPLSSPLAAYNPDYDYKINNPHTDFYKAVNPLRDLAKVATLIQPGDPWLDKFCQYLQEYSAHLLLNFRPSPYFDLKRDKVMDSDGMRRQKALDAKTSELQSQAERVVTRQSENVDKVAGFIEAAKVKMAQEQLVQPLEPLTVQPEREEKLDSPLDSIVVPKGLLQGVEQPIIESFLRQGAHLSKESQIAGQQAIEKLVESATLASKAHHFSEATREQILSIAEDNRALAISEISALIEGTAPAEELDALYTLRVSNRYLASRHSERNEARQSA